MPDNKNRQAALNAAAGAAAKRLKDAHLDEYNSYYQQEAKIRGENWSPRPTPEQRARAEFDRLVAENPDLLADYVGPKPSEPSVTAESAG